ncbi:MAG: tRNA lysidine(34) synthetase TilS [Nitrospiria bacterium]
MFPLTQKVRRALVRFGVRPTDTLVVAVSGGPDSVCLLHLLKQLPPPYRLSLHVAHLNHQFRPEAAREARFVEGLAEKWGLPATIAARPVSDFCKKNRLSKQAGARVVRYEFCHEVAKKTGAQWIALGHTADDQAETVLMRMLRGSGALGLGGMPGKRAPHIVRPLIDCGRREIQRVLHKDNIPYIEDPSNKKPVYLRNRIRHHLIPTLEQYNPNIKHTLCREAELLQSEDDLMHQWMLNLIPDLGIQCTENSVAFSMASLRTQHVAMQRRLLRWGIKKILCHLNGITFEHIETLIKKGLKGRTGQTLQLLHGIVAITQYSKLILKREESARKVLPPEISRKVCVLPEITAPASSRRVQLPEWGLCFKMSLSGNRPLVFSACIASFDFDSISLPLYLRTWQPGDRFAPLGMGGHRKKIQDFFVDAKIPKEDRHRVPLLISAQGILWVVGHRIDERFRATESTARILTIEIVEGSHGK